MKILAADASSSRVSLALLVDGQLKGADSWAAGRASQHRLPEAIPEILEANGLRLADIDVFAAGRGPGNFSGMRTSMATFQALSMPGGQDLRYVVSGTAMAAAAAKDHPESRQIIVLGDARRSRVWSGIYTVADGSVQVEEPFTLHVPEDLSKNIDSAALLVSSDWERLGKLLPESLTGCSTCELFPSAEWIAVLAGRDVERGGVPEAGEPLYMHPAVAEK